MEPCSIYSSLTHVEVNLIKCGFTWLDQVSFGECDDLDIEVEGLIFYTIGLKYFEI